MATIAEIAHVKMRGGDIPEPGSEGEELVLAAWKAYSYISARAGRTGEVMVHSAATGHTWEGDVEEVFHVLWPAGQPPLSLVPWDEGFRTVRNWLLATSNIAPVDRGRPNIRTRNEGLIEGRKSKWWVRDRFSGAPDGMKLPDLDDSGQPAATVVLPSSLEPVEAPPAPVPASASRADNATGAPDWWCIFGVNGNCMASGPYTRSDFRVHLIRDHKFRPDSSLYEKYMRESEALREERLGSMPTAPAIQPPPTPVTQSPPTQSLIDIGARTLGDFPPPAPKAAPAPAPAREVPVGTVSAQARGFAAIVADLEEENARLRRENKLLRERAERAEAGMELAPAVIDKIARRTAALVQSKDGA